MKLDAEFIKKVENDHFRTDQDTGAHPNALLIWNIVRQHVGLPKLSISQLQTFCNICNGYHYSFSGEKNENQS